MLRLRGHGTKSPRSTSRRWCRPADHRCTTRRVELCWSSCSRLRFAATSPSTFPRLRHQTMSTSVGGPSPAGRVGKRATEACVFCRGRKVCASKVAAIVYVLSASDESDNPRSSVAQKSQLVQTARRMARHVPTSLSQSLVQKVLLLARGEKTRLPDQPREHA